MALRVLVAHHRYRPAPPSGENGVVEHEIRMLAEAGVQVVPLLPSVSEMPRLATADAAARADLVAPHDPRRRSDPTTGTRARPDCTFATVTRATTAVAAPSGFLPSCTPAIGPRIPKVPSWQRLLVKACAQAGVPLRVAGDGPMRGIPGYVGPMTPAQIRHEIRSCAVVAVHCSMRTRS